MIAALTRLGEQRLVSNGMEAGMTWREMWAMASETVAPLYAVWWRFDLVEIRRLRERGLA